MSHVNVIINGRQYRMACEEGEEARLQSLADNFEARINDVRGKFGEAGDARLTVMAALMVSDELRDAELQIQRLEAEIASLQVVRAGFNEQSIKVETAVVGALDAAADRIEKMTEALSRPSGGGMAIG